MCHTNQLEIFDTEKKKPKKSLKLVETSLVLSNAQKKYLSLFLIFKTRKLKKIFLRRASKLDVRGKSLKIVILCIYFLEWQPAASPLQRC